MIESLNYHNHMRGFLKLLSNLFSFANHPKYIQISAIKVCENVGSHRQSHNPYFRHQMLKGRSYSYHHGDDLAAIRCRGSDVELADLPNRMVTTITTPEEAALLNRHDLDDLASKYLLCLFKHVPDDFNGNVSGLIEERISKINTPRSYR